ncbi:GatB/YqeY domain-containing protein [Marininema halotolerans]|uniref:GatB/YqeY domain-containing protein n=1 Tax=Marininema halotolerans TaxID=1155944 RepID=UPI000B821F45|nr:GatB/YqeY domain-containing protein [Marininema halotolerans]
MTLNERLTLDMKAAMKNKEKDRLTVIRRLRSSVKNEEIELRRPLNEDEALSVVVKEYKQQQDSLAEFQQAGREDLVEKVQMEIAILKDYLPAPLSEDELRKMVQEAVEQIGATSKADMKKVMTLLMPQVKGRADGKTVNRLVQESLQ